MYFNVINVFKILFGGSGYFDVFIFDSNVWNNYSGNSRQFNVISAAEQTLA